MSSKEGREVLGIPISHFAVRRSGNYGIEVRYNEGRRKVRLLTAFIVSISSCISGATQLD